ncbi:MAG: hypothetical protein HY811_08785 [Planctomycetes bacterium]|nr:hypothetical protein [Planctomycetota bacterium]
MDIDACQEIDHFPYGEGLFLVCGFPAEVQVVLSILIGIVMVIGIFTVIKAARKSYTPRKPQKSTEKQGISPIFLGAEIYIPVPLQSRVPCNSVAKILKAYHPSYYIANIVPSTLKARLKRFYPLVRLYSFF